MTLIGEIARIVEIGVLWGVAFVINDLALM
jgi:hypothetical protein